jgi:hypothetical protein
VKRKLLPAVAALAVFGSIFVTGVAGAGTGADTTVTIKTQNGDFWGFVSSPRPYKCAKNRKIVLFKQIGTVQDPTVDHKVASDTASLNGDRYEWQTGNTGMYGKFYARAGRTLYCKADTSPTVKSLRP